MQGFFAITEYYLQYAILCLLQKSYWARGKTLGGTGNLNYMAYVRGSRHDYDGWAAGGADGWAYDDVLPYFLKLEDMQDESLKTSGVCVCCQQ
jgi:choline dehydrogenase-like flavoprotein